MPVSIISQNVLLECVYLLLQFDRRANLYFLVALVYLQ